MNLTDILNIFVLLLPFIGGYFIYALQKKAKLLDDIVSRLYSIEKKQAVTDNIIDNINGKR